jgi:hypothetical protein
MTSSEVARVYRFVKVEVGRVIREKSRPWGLKGEERGREWRIASGELPWFVLPRRAPSSSRGLAGERGLSGVVAQDIMSLATAEEGAS